MDELDAVFGEEKNFDLLPDGMWMNGIISNVERRQKIFANKPIFKTDANKQPILDSKGNPIPAIEWNITIELPDFKMAGSDKLRKTWIALAESSFKKAVLPAFFQKVTGKELKGLTRKQAMEELTGKKIQLMLKNIVSKNGKLYQKVIPDMVKAVI